MRAVVAQENHTAAVQEKSKPTPGPKQVLIRNTAFGLNPTDWYASRLLTALSKCKLMEPITFDLPWHDTGSTSR